MKRGTEDFERKTRGRGITQAGKEKGVLHNLEEKDKKKSRK
jgi:hypothetical protein